VRSGPGGWVWLPAGVACLEDSATAPDFRGRGVAPAAWTAVGDRLRERGTSVLVTKVAIENVASCRAVAKAGFVHVATMRAIRLGPHVAVEVDHAGAGRDRVGQAGPSVGSAPSGETPSVGEALVEVGTDAEGSPYSSAAHT
jgi:GNAT superfamily N-acetyltransferase